MKTLRLTLLLILSLFSSNSQAKPGIYGPIATMPLTNSKQVIAIPASLPFMTGHHTMCLFVMTDKGIIFGGVAGDVISDGKTESYYCKKNQQTLLQLVKNKQGMTPDEYFRFSQQYSKTTSNYGIGHEVQNAAGFLAAPFSNGTTKPCFMEVQRIRAAITDACQPKLSPAKD